VNDISAYASIELNLDIMDTEFAKEVTSRMQHTIEKDCIHITNENLKSYNIITRFLQWWSYEVFRAVLYIFTFYFRQQDDQ
jgi:cardiolipin synthase